VVLTDVEGVYASWPDPDTLLSQLSVSAAADLMTRVSAGMRPKLEACVRAVTQGVPQAHIIDGRQLHSLLLEVFTGEGIGTMIIPDAEADRVARLRADDQDGLALDVAAAEVSVSDVRAGDGHPTVGPAAQGGDV
jgi:glutamate 5-kinase